VWGAKELVKEAMTAARDAMRAPTHLAKEPPRCQKCKKGGGVLESGEFCDCPMGRDMAKARRQAEKPKPAATKGAA
jgi:hypothetical protein